MYEDEDENNTSAGSNTDTEAYREQLKKSTTELSNLAEQSGEPYNVRIDRTEYGQVRGAEIRTSQTKKGQKGFTTTTSVEKKYRFASNATESRKLVPDPSYNEETVIIKDGRNTRQQTRTEVREYESFKTPGEMVRIEATSNEVTKTKGDKYYFSSTNSHVSVGNRSDKVETSKMKVSVEGYNLRTSTLGDLNASVEVRADLKDKEFQSFQGYERQEDPNGNLKYKLKQESYVVRDKKTNISTVYKEDSHGNLSVKSYDAENVEIKSGSVTKQMKKDYEKYKKLIEKLVRQASEAKTSLAYMEATQMYTENEVTEANMSKKSLEYVGKAQNDVAIIIAKKSKDKIR